MPLLLARKKVRPFYGQVEIGDPAVKGSPQFETGEERVVVLPQRLVVATQGDQEGPVQIEVWKNDDHGDTLRGAILVHEGQLEVVGNQLEIGSYMGSDLHRFDIEPGSHRIAVYTKPVDSVADTVIFVLEP